MLKARFRSCGLVSARAFQQVIKFKHTMFVHACISVCMNAQLHMCMQYYYVHV